MKKRFLQTLFITLLSFATYNFSAGSFAQTGGVLVYPTIVDLDFVNNQRPFESRVIQIENPTTETFRVRAYVEGWDLDEFGSIKFLDKPDINSLNDKLKFNPREFDLLPGQKQSVRMSAKMPEGADGEYKSIIFFETVNPKQEIIKPSGSELNVNITYKTRYGVTVYAYKGKISRNIEIDSLKPEKIDSKQYLVATVKNSGNVHCTSDISYKLAPKSNGGAIESNARFTVMPGKTQKLRIQLPEDKMANGDYSADLKLNYKNAQGKPQLEEAEADFSYVNTSESTKAKLQTTELEPVKSPETIAKPIAEKSVKAKVKKR